MKDTAAYRRALIDCRKELQEFINEENCNPIMIRLAWHDSGTFDASVSAPWPAAGGANGSIRFDTEMSHGANAGLSKALNFLKPFKEDYPMLSWADLMQMASAEAVALAGGPIIDMRYGRVDTEVQAECPKEGNLPDAYPPFGDKAADAATHLRNIFHRMGFSDQELVALSGAHTLGRAFKERSGVVEEGYGKGKGTCHTEPTAVVRCDGDVGVGMAGGRSWTKEWLKFDNSYFQYLVQPKDDKLLWMPTDAALHKDPKLLPYFETYARSQDTFFADYAKAHKKLSELGSKFEPAEGIVLEPMVQSKL